MRLLLHACCGPCSIIPVEGFKAAGYDVTLYFANPNIQPVKEYLRRREALEIFAKKANVPVIWQDDAYSLQGWLAYVHEKGIADNQGKARCTWCTESRLTLTHFIAKAQGFQAFSTSLLYSVYQDHETIKAQGEALSSNNPTESPLFAYEDFRPQWKKGVELSKEYELYRQAYCACVFSEADRYAKAFSRLGQ